MRIVKSTAATLVGVCVLLSACSSRDNAWCHKSDNDLNGPIKPAAHQELPRSVSQDSITNLQSKTCEDGGFWRDYNVAIEQIWEFSQFYLKLRLTPAASDDVSYTFHQNTGSTQVPDCQHSTHSEATDDGLV